MPRSGQLRYSSIYSYSSVRNAKRLSALPTKGGIWKNLGGRDGGIRTHTGWILSPLSLPLDYIPICEVEDSDFHRGRNLLQKSLIAYWGQGATPGFFFTSLLTSFSMVQIKPTENFFAISLCDCVSRRSQVTATIPYTLTIVKLLFSPDLYFYDIVPQVMTPRLAFVASVPPTTSPLWCLNLAKHMHLLDYNC